MFDQLVRPPAQTAHSAVAKSFPKTSVEALNKAAWATNTGLVRTHNEDACTIVDAVNFYALADGMGGYNAGEVASKVAIDTMRTQVEEQFCLADSHEQRATLLRDAAANANSAILNAAKLRPECLGMGTTLVAMLVRAEPQPSQLHAERHAVATVLHIGDSRCYHYSAQRQSLTLITKDHSIGQELIDRGDVHAEEIGRFPMRGVLTRAMGVEDAPMFDTVSFDVQSGDLLLLCSDGLSDMLRAHELVQAFSGCDTKTPEQLACELVNAALEQGGNDNVSALLVRI